MRRKYLTEYHDKQKSSIIESMIAAIKGRMES